MSDRTEEEQIEVLKTWWKDYGKTVVAAVAVGLAAFFGWNYYQDSKMEKAQERSVTFDKLVTVMTEADDGLSEQELAQVQQIAGELANTDTLYADFSELYLAKLAIQQNELDKAQRHLQTVADGGSNEAVQDLARLRLARVMASRGDVEAALKILSSEPNGAYASAYAEVRGDILLAQNRLQDAQDAYKAALSGIGNQPMRRNILQLKLDNTRVASDAPETAPGGMPGGNPHALPNPHANEAGDA